jgi:putative restriction endonuclease
MLRSDAARFAHIYRVLLHAARAEGIGPGRLPDFLGLEHGGELTLLGQEELDIALLEADLREKIARHAAGSALSELETERVLLAAARVGQHVFAGHVLANCGSRCVFCGLRPASFGAKRMLLAGHIKPWKDSTPSERLDPRNGLAACPAHDVAFDTGLLTVNGGTGRRSSSLEPIARPGRLRDPTHVPASTHEYSGGFACSSACSVPIWLQPLSSRLGSSLRPQGRLTQVPRRG